MGTAPCLPEPLASSSSPPTCGCPWLWNQGTRSEFAIFGEEGRLGTIWTTYRMDETGSQSQSNPPSPSLPPPTTTSVQREDLIWIAGPCEQVGLPAGSRLPVAPMLTASSLAPLSTRKRVGTHKWACPPTCGCPRRRASTPACRHTGDALLARRIHSSLVTTVNRSVWGASWDNRRYIVQPPRRTC